MKVLWPHDSPVPTLTLGSKIGFLPAVWQELVQNLCQLKDWNRCDSCKTLYQREKRAAKTGQNNLCIPCRKTGAQRLYAQRQRAKRARARQLHAAGVALEEIAQQCGVDVQKVEKWVTSRTAKASKARVGQEAEGSPLTTRRNDVAS
jgi:hypothetical protein